MPQNKKEVIAKRRADAAELYLKGWWQSKIAEHLGVKQSCISKDIAVIHKQWLASAIEDVATLKQRELAKIDNLEVQYWEAWEKSKVSYKQKITKAKGVTGATTPAQQEQTVREMVVYGDPRFLSGIEWCISQRCKILGVEAPIKISNETQVIKVTVKKAAVIPTVPPTITPAPAEPIKEET